MFVVVTNSVQFVARGCQAPTFNLQEAQIFRVELAFAAGMSHDPARKCLGLNIEPPLPEWLNGVGKFALWTCS